MITVVRYDSLAVMGESIANSSGRSSPKTTIGVTPIAGLMPYVT
jgi:hypothetical protein